MKDKLKMRNRFIFSISPKKYVYLYKEKISKAFLICISYFFDYWSYSRSHECCNYFRIRKNYKNDFKSG